jgi:hypothetical protein
MSSVSGQTTRRFGKSTHSHRRFRISDIRAANSNCSRIAKISVGCSRPSASALTKYAKSSEQSLFQPGWFAEGLLTQTLMKAGG